MAIQNIHNIELHCSKGPCYICHVSLPEATLNPRENRGKKNVGGKCVAIVLGSPGHFFTSNSCWKWWFQKGIFSSKGFIAFKTFFLKIWTKIGTPPKEGGVKIKEFENYCLVSIRCKKKYKASINDVLLYHKTKKHVWDVKKSTLQQSWRVKNASFEELEKGLQNGHLSIAEFKNKLRPLGGAIFLWPHVAWKEPPKKSL